MYEGTNSLVEMKGVKTCIESQEGLQAAKLNHQPTNKYMYDGTNKQAGWDAKSTNV